jgi:UDP-N-acetylmuramoylalanine--D-glutamate ligase
VILGGRGKGEDFGALADAVLERARAVYLIGEAAGEIAAALAPGAATAQIPITACGTLAVAVAAAAAAAGEGEVVLLSPACTSYDQFRDFEARGVEFKRLVLGA